MHTLIMFHVKQFALYHIYAAGVKLKTYFFRVILKVVLFEKLRVLQSTYIRTVRVGGGRRRGCFSRHYHHHSGVFQCKALILLNKHTDNVSLRR